MSNLTFKANLVPGSTSQEYALGSPTQIWKIYGLLSGTAEYAVAAGNGGVTGVKGNSETNYRTGQVSITKSNIGLGNVENTALSTWQGSTAINTVGTLTTGSIPWSLLTEVPIATTTTIGIVSLSSATNSNSQNVAATPAAVQSVYNLTKKTTGATNSSSAIFLIGALEQGENQITYSNTQVYATNGTLTATTFNGALNGSAAQVKGTLTIGDKTYNGATNTTVELVDLNLTKAVDFLGVTTTPISATANTTANPVTLISGSSVTATNGNVVLVKDSGEEFIWTENRWEPLGLATNYALANHIHGNINSRGTITATEAIANGHHLVITNSNNEVTSSSITFGTSTTTFLTNKGTWATPTNTKNTTGGANSIEKLFLVGNMSQGTTVSYSHSAIFMQNGTLNATTFIGAFNGTASNAITASYAASSNCASHATYAGTATYAVSSNCASHATYAGTATYAISSGCAVNATYAGTATYAISSNCASHAIHSGSAIYAESAGSATDNTKVLKAGDTMTGDLKANGSATLGTSANPWHQLVLGGATNATMTAASTNPRITFQDSTGTQPVHLIYTDYDNYRAPAGLKIVGGSSANPAWFESEGKIYADNAINQLLTGSGVAGKDNGSGDNRYQPAKWTFNTGLNATDGDIYTIKIPVAGHDYGIYMSVDNGTNYYPIVHNGTGRLTTQYPINSYIQVVFESNGSAASMFPLNGGTSRATVDNGVFRVINFYDSGNSYCYLRNENGRFYAGATGLNPYSLACLDNSNRYSMLLTNSTNAGTGTNKTINTSGKYKLPAVILYYNGNNTAAANTLVTSAYQTFIAHYAVDTRYSHNYTTTFTTNTPLYIECTIDSNGYWSPTTKCITQTLTAGKYYIYLGLTYSTAYQLSLAPEHPCYYYDGTNLTDYTHHLYVTSSGSSGYLAKFDSSNKIINGPQLGNDTTKFLNNKGEWVTVSTQLDYGDTLPATGNTGDVFLQLSDPYYELPVGGVAGQALVKATNDDRVVTWQNIIPSGGVVGQALIKSNNGNGVAWGNIGGIMTPSNNTKYYVSGSSSISENANPAIFNTNVYVENSVLFGAAWNDYAEYRVGEQKFKPGVCVIEKGDDSLILSTRRMQPGASIVSDTFGFAIGETEQANTPIAVAGRVLAYPYEDLEIFKQNIGHPVCSGPNGTVSIMTDEEYKEQGYCAIGIISAIPEYEEWGTNNIKVDNRIWIKVG